jgi:two-component system, NarL family, sensor histidine kinase DesK
VTTPTASDRSGTALVGTVLVGTVLVGYALLAYAAVAPGLNVVGVLLGAVLTLGVVAVQLGYVSRPGVRRSREGSALALLALACLVYVPVVALSVGWIGFAGFLAGSLLVLLPPRAGLAGLAVVVVSVGVLVALAGASWLAVLTSAVGTLVTGLVVHGLTRLWALTPARTVDPVAEDPVAGVPVAEDPVVAEDEKADEKPTPEKADEKPTPEKADEKADEKPTPEEPGEPDEEPAADPPDRPALAVGLGTARAELAAAGVELSVLGEDVDLPEEVDTLFAALLRVAVGHAARHADATTCHVTIVRRGAEARIVVTHDGATDDPDPEDFEALGDRFDAADGSVLAERDDAEFTVDGRLPVPQASSRSST